MAANSKISQLTNLTTAQITGNEKIPVPFGSSNKALTTSLIRQNDITQEKTGFRYPAEMQRYYDVSTRTYFITGNVQAYYQGILIPELVTGWISEPHPDTLDVWFLYHNGTAFVWSTTPWTFDMLMIGLAVPQYALGFNENHGMMPPIVHERFHEIAGTTRTSGGVFSGYTLNSTTAANRRPAISQCLIEDEDLPTVLPAQTGNYTIASIDGAGLIAFTVPQTDLVLLSGNQPYYNSIAGGLGSQVLMSANHYAAIFVAALPVTDDVESQAKRFVFFQAQQTSATLENIQALAVSGLNLANFRNFAQEFVFIEKIIIRYQAGNWTLISSESLAGNKYSQFQSAPQLPHDLLSGLNVGDYQHLTAAEKANFVAAKVTTVGTGGDYATISEAITAGAKSILLLSNVTEIAIIQANYISINLNSFTLSMLTYNIKLSNSKVFNGTISHTNSISSTFIITNTNANDTSLYQDITINNQATTGSIRSCSVVTYTNLYFNRVIFNLPNQDQCWGDNSNTNGIINFQNCKIVLSGTSCSPRIIGNFFNVIISGTAGAIAILGAKISCGIITLANTRIDLNRSNDVYIASSGTNTISLNDFSVASEAHYNNIEIAGAATSIVIVGRLVNCRFSCNAAYTIGANGSANSAFSSINNSEFTNTTGTITVRKNTKLTNNFFNLGITISQSFAKLIGNEIGSVNAGTKTITVEAAADKTQLAFNTTEAAISDLGTNTTLSNNILF